jgi:hypothetical protein
MEVRGYANAAQWVYNQALEPGTWTDGKLLTLTELRHVHEVALGPAWDVAPHPSATPRERPGSFREHDIAPFPGGMTPPSWPDVPAAVHGWLDDVRRIPRVERRVEALAVAHAAFERIHPFLDGRRAGSARYWSVSRRSEVQPPAPRPLLTGDLRLYTLSPDRRLLLT